MANINGNTGGLVMEVLAKTGGNAGYVTTPGITDTGFAVMATENDDGSILGTRNRYSPETTTDYRLRVGIDTILDQEVFNYSLQNTGKHSCVLSTFTMALSGAGVVSNSSSGVAANSSCLLKTQRNFTLNGQQSVLFVETVLSLQQAIATNTTIDVGLFQQSGSAPFAPTDGVYLRVSSSGVFAVINNNGVEATTLMSGLTLAINQVYQVVISVTNRDVRFWVDDVLRAAIEVPSGQQQLFQSQSLPWAWRHAIGGTAAGTACQMKVFSYSVFCGDVQRNKDWGATCVAMGGGQQVQQGAATGGQLSTYALGAAPGAITLTASTAPATNTLGGLYLLPAAITAGESDYPIFAWQNPAGTSIVPGKVFHCTGVTIGDQLVTTALTGGGIATVWAIGFGSTAASLATTETTSFTSGTTKIARKLPLGIVQDLPVTAAAGVKSVGRQVLFPETIVVNPGEFLHAIARFIGTSTSAGAIRGSVTFHGYFE